MKKLMISALTLSVLAGCGTAGLPVRTWGQSTASTKVSARQVESRMLVNGVPNGVVEPARSGKLAFSFAGAEGPYTRYDEMHGKFMHLIAVSSDLETFAHMHPGLDATGTFTQAINQAASDPDNRDAARAMPKPGTYFLFGEVTPAGQGIEEPRFTLKAEGTAAAAPLRLDAPLPDGTIRKFFTADGAVGQAGDPYQATLSVEKGEHHPGMPMITLTLNLQMTHAQTRHYTPVTNLEPWMGMTGHAIVIGAAGRRVQDKVFRHLHSGHGGHLASGNPLVDGGGHGGGGHGDEPGPGGPDVTFMLMGDEVPAAGTYKIWVQTKHNGRVLTLPFVVRF